MGYLASYASAYAKSETELDITIYRDPQELRAVLQEALPDVIGFSNFLWNNAISLSFARYVKKLKPDCLVLMGGPNVPLIAFEQEQFIRNMPEVDVYTVGNVYEGEPAFLNVLQAFIDTGCDIDALKSSAVDGNFWIDPKTDSFVKGGMVPRIRNLDEIPSPYLTGYLDKFFDTKLHPAMLTNRGCPFGCTFCYSSLRSNNKVFRFSAERVRDELDYIVERVDKTTALSLADDNFGMFREDEENAEHIGHLIDAHNWPTHLRTTTGKNQPDRVLRVMDKVRGRMMMSASVQSLNPSTLENIERTNIRLDVYKRVQESVLERGQQAMVDLIMCLPGETYSSYISSIEQMMDLGVRRINGHTLVLLHGTPMASAEQREEFQYTTRYRIVTRCIGDYDIGEIVVETEEVVAATRDLAFEEYLDLRSFQLLLTIYYFEKNFEEVFRLAEEFGVKPFDLIQTMSQMTRKAPPSLKTVFDKFRAETEGELFDTKEECVDWGRKNYNALIAGEVGGNLLFNYAITARFFEFDATLSFLRDTVLAACPKLSKSQTAQLDAVIDYIGAVLLRVPFKELMRQNSAMKMDYDVVSWVHGKFENPLEAYALSEPRRYKTMMNPNTQDMIESRINAYGEHVSGLSRITRMWLADAIRKEMRVDPAE